MMTSFEMESYTRNIPIWNNKILNSIDGKHIRILITNLLAIKTIQYTNIETVKKIVSLVQPKWVDILKKLGLI